MIRIPIKNGNLDAALDKFASAKKEQNRKFDEQVSAFFTPKSKDDAEAKKPSKTPGKNATYESILTRSRRMG